MTDFRDLCARMADELDHYRQLLMDDRREVHALAAEARAALADPEPTSLKEQALAALEGWAEDQYGPGAVFHKGLEVGLIRRAIESLPD